MKSLWNPRCGAARVALAWLATAASLSVTMPASAQAWAPNEMLISPQADLLDPEYNQARGLITWGDQDGKLWVCTIDRNTGMFFPPDCKGVLVDADAMKTADAKITGNGPEWVFGAGGDGIAYTKFVGRSHTNPNARIGYAAPLPDGTWSSGFLAGPDVPRKAPYGSETPDDPNPLITYIDSNNVHYWREVNDPASERILTSVPPKGTPIRLVRGARAVVFIATVGRDDQIFYTDLDTNQTTQLTFDAGDKNPVFMWRAPEYGNEFVFMTVVNRNEVRVYRNLPKPGTGELQWTPVYSAFSPAKTSIISPEPFVYDGRSYVFMAVIVPGTDFASEIWFSNIDSANPMIKRISDNTTLRARTDPEVFVTNQGPLIYYNRRNVTLTPKGKYKFCGGVECSEGIHAANPGPLP